MDELALVGDVGGTHARFALARGGAPFRAVAFPVADSAGTEIALDRALDRLGAPRVSAARIAVAGIVENGSARLTNGAWRFDRRAIARRTGAARVELFNDVQAAALGLRRLAPGDAAPLGGGGALDFGRPVALLAVGTGFGAALLTPDGRALAGEAGHAALAAGDEEEAEIVRRLRRQTGFASLETALSGPGLSRLSAALGGDAGAPPATVVARALAGRAPEAAALRRFCLFLGAAAGDLALAFGAWGGVAICGGVPRRFAGFLRRSPFRARFEARGRFAERLRAAPTVLVERDDLALLGLAALP